MATAKKKKTPQKVTINTKSAKKKKVAKAPEKFVSHLKVLEAVDVNKLVNMDLFEKWMKRLAKNKRRITGYLKVVPTMGKLKGKDCFCAMGDLADMVDPEGWIKGKEGTHEALVTKDNPEGKVTLYKHRHGGFAELNQEFLMDVLGIGDEFQGFVVGENDSDSEYELNTSESLVDVIRSELEDRLNEAKEKLRELISETRDHRL